MIGSAFQCNICGADAVFSPEGDWRESPAGGTCGSSVKMKPDTPGGVIQIDAVFINLAPGRAIKHFTAYDPVAKSTVVKAANRATARAASLFLDKVIAEMPFPVRAIQVDGGSEFKAEFEQTCAEKGLTLYELRPSDPA